MVARHIISETIHFFASPEYLEKVGKPISPDELPQHNSILFRYPNGRIFNDVPFGKDRTLQVKGNLCVNSLATCLEATLMGRGISMMPLPFAKEHIDTGELVMLFEDVEPYEGKCFLVYPSRRFISLASQRFIDFMMQAMEECMQNGSGRCDREIRLRGAIKSMI